MVGRDGRDTWGDRSSKRKGKVEELLRMVTGPTATIEPFATCRTFGGEYHQQGDAT